MKSPEPTKTCAEISPLLVFYACEEVDEQERASIESHLAVCPNCQAQLAEEHEFLSAVESGRQASGKLDSSGMLLSQCRSELAEKLDDLASPPVKEKVPAFHWLRRWMTVHPAWSGALLVLVGLLAGVQSTQWFTGRNDANDLDQAVNVRPTPRFTEDQLSKTAVTSVNFTPSAGAAPQTVRVQMSAEQPVELSGSLDDTDVRQVLAYVVKNGDRFESGVRLDCLEALRARAHDEEVRSALLSAARKDQNPAVRLKALEALRDSFADSDVRDTLLQALKHDSNPGVRVEAVNLLVRSVDNESLQSLAPPALPGTPLIAPGTMHRASNGNAPADDSMENVIRALEDLQRNDPSRYVRLRSAAALRQISARNDH